MYNKKTLMIIGFSVVFGALITLIISVLFVALVQYRACKHTQKLLGYASGIRDFTVKEVEKQLGRKYYTLSKRPNNTLIQAEIKQLEEKADILRGITS